MDKELNDAAEKYADESDIVITVKLPTTSDLFKKHFNDYGGIGLLHPNVESFFNELNDTCLMEDLLKKLQNQKPTTNERFR